jgi:hypothetical protein
MKRSISGLAIALCLLTVGRGAVAVELWSNRSGDQRYSLTTTLKWTSILSHAPKDTVLYPERWSSANLWRMRLALDAQPASWLRAEVAYEQRARHISESSGAAGGRGILPTERPAPYRLGQADEPLVEIGGTFSYRHELDRALLAFRLGNSEVVVGRQAVGWGRGVMFRAVDIFVPFTPLESDREWRRGIDAVRGSLPVTDRIAVDAVIALGESRDESVFAGRLHGYAGNVDAAIIVGKRREDYLAGVSASVPLFDAEVHGEFALFHTPESLPEGGVFGREDLAAESVAGGSYSVSVGKELLIIAEYHFSAFGVGDIQELPVRLLDTAFRERILMGDTQILGRHAVALQIGYGVGEEAPVSASWIFSPPDGSGVIIPSATWLFSDNVTLIASAYLAHGAGPGDGVIRSEYGGTPASGLLQINFTY